MGESDIWRADFESAARRRGQIADPEWERGSVLTPAVARSVQKFQVGESGDGAHLIAEAVATGDHAYAAAVRLFVAEEQNHARMLGRLLRAAGWATVHADWTDVVFVRLRRLLGLRLELMILAVAEVIALRYYRALADGGHDPLLVDVARRILDDEQRHVPFQCHRLRVGFADFPRAVRFIVENGWRLTAFGVTVVVAFDHGSALAELGVGRRQFISDTWPLFGDVIGAVFGDRQ
ncbi:ferritin-like domain-containing protein [Gordonia sp. DT219]|uniref:ferritin-like domain-containing protein n=1 Tax=Gordonia sp. DT219 TaxID=3416658 RepID=UPI003CFA63CB